MGYKLILAILSVAFAAVITKGFEEGPALQNIIEDLINDLTDKVQHLSDAAFQAFAGALNALIKIGKGIIDGFSGAAGTIIGPIIDKIRQIAKSAIDAGIDISECSVEEAIKEISQLPSFFLEQVNHCVNTITKNANKIMKGGKDAIIKITDVVKKLAQDASKCGVIDPLCWAALGPKVAAAGIEIPLQINKVIANTVGLLQGLQISIVDCNADNLSGLVKEANRILQNVTQCVSRHQPHK